jgi:lipid A ethanolaminephosphotransferase
LLASNNDGPNAVCLNEQRTHPVSHDHLFHTVLGMFDVATEIYRADRDLLRPCVISQTAGDAKLSRPAKTAGV